MSDRQHREHTPSRVIAFRVLIKHQDCLREDVSLNKLVNDIAAEIDRARDRRADD